MTTSRLASCATLVTAFAIAGCAPQMVSEPLPPPPGPLPQIAVEQLGPPAVVVTPEERVFPGIPELEGHGLGPPITLTASNVDVRALIPVLAEELGMNIVLGPDVEGRITVFFEEVPALVALRSILDEVGLVLLGSESPPLWSPVVFYQLPVNIDFASLELVQARFGVSRAIAETAVGWTP